MSNPALHNPQLDGGPFLWEGGPIGVLLSHGYTATTTEVRWLGEILHQHGYTVMGPLLPGHGTTPQELNRCRWQAWGAEVERAYRELAGRCEKVFVGGESMGAVLALYLASEHPEIVGVLTYAPALVAALSSWDRLKLQLAAPFVAELPKGQLDVPERWQGYPGNPLKAAVQLLCLQREVRGRLSRISQPVLTVQGRLDRAVDHSGAEIIQREVRSSLKELHWMEQSTHVVLLDRELEAVAEITLNFMEKALLRS